MQIIGTLEANFQGGREYSAGGVGPLFRAQRIEEPYSVWEMLSRCVEALAKLDVLDVVSLFIDAEEIPLPEFEDEEENGDLGGADESADKPADDDDYVEFDLADEAQRNYSGEDATSFHLVLTYDDDTFSHLITVEASVDHPSDEAAISVLDRATPMDDEVAYDGEDALQDALEQFLMRLESELNKELALEAPEKEIWTEMSVEEDLGGGGSSTGLPV
jgi:hypothetical protein